MKVDIGAESTFTKDDLEFMILAISHYVDHNQAYKCVRLLKESLERLTRKPC